LAHVVPKNERVVRRFSASFNRTDMSSRAGMEVEAINRLTDGIEPPAVRAILVQCLAGELAPSAAIAGMLAEESPSTVRTAIDGVTHRAATISRANDMLVHDRVDELTQIFVENVAGLADVSDATKRKPGPEPLSPPRASADPDELRAAE
jgi:hypothetical protein